MDRGPATAASPRWDDPGPQLPAPTHLLGVGSEALGIQWAHTSKHGHHGGLPLGQEGRQSGETWPWQGFGSEEGSLRGRPHPAVRRPSAVKARATGPCPGAHSTRLTDSGRRSGLQASADRWLHLEPPSLTRTHPKISPLSFKLFLPCGAFPSPHPPSRAEPAQPGATSTLAPC